jgi:hypothetical protein
MVVSEAARRVALTCALTSILTIPTAASASAQSSEAADAARSAAAIGLEWLGPHPEPNPDLDVREPLWQGPGAMFVEQQVARRVIRSWWPGLLADSKADAILDGFAAYLQSRIVEGVFDRRYLRLAHSVEARPYFGGHVIWSFPTLRLSRHALIGRDRHAAVFDALERWLGTPTLQAAMFEVAHLPDDRLTADAIGTTMSNAAGQDLSWLFDAAEAEVSYAVSALTATSVTVARNGTGMFTGRSAARIGDFESGDAVRLRVAFGNGETTLVTWDGRDQTRTFQFKGPSPVTAAYLDPDRIITLDRNRLDNAIVTPSPTNVPVRKWAARWMVWLQHTMLSYGFLA